MREVLTYSRRGSRFNPRQQQAWDAYAGRWWSRTTPSTSPAFSLAGLFGRQAPLSWRSARARRVDGCPRGRPTRLRRPRVRGLAPRCRRDAGPDRRGRSTNVRLLLVDAVWSIEHLVDPDVLRGCGPSSPTRGTRSGTTSAGWSRRFAALAASRLAPGAEWRLATDWADYAEQMVDGARRRAALEVGLFQRWAERPVTKFERKGLSPPAAHHRPGLPPRVTGGGAVTTRVAPVPTRRRTPRPARGRAARASPGSGRRGSSRCSR